METSTTPKTDLELFQALRIEALEKKLLEAKELLAEMQTAMNNYINNIEVEL